jgi:hypothetical protein
MRPCGPRWGIWGLPASERRPRAGADRSGGRNPPGRNRGPSECLASVPHRVNHLSSAGCGQWRTDDGEAELGRESRGGTESKTAAMIIQRRVDGLLGATHRLSNHVVGQGIGHAWEHTAMTRRIPTGLLPVAGILALIVACPRLGAATSFVRLLVEVFGIALGTIAPSPQPSGHSTG